jgi:hypothetical protein
MLKIQFFSVFAMSLLLMCTLANAQSLVSDEQSGLDFGIEIFEKKLLTIVFDQFLIDFSRKTKTRLGQTLSPSRKVQCKF